MCTVPSVYLLVVCFLTFLYFFVKYVCAFENYCLFVYLHMWVFVYIFLCLLMFLCLYVCDFIFFVHLCMCGCGCVCVLSVRDYVYIYNNKWYQNISLLLLLHSLLSPQLSWLSPGHCRDLEQSYNSQQTEIGIMTGNMKWISVISK